MEELYKINHSESRVLLTVCAKGQEVFGSSFVAGKVCAKQQWL